MEQDQSNAKKKRDEASQHPGSEMKRVDSGGVKADRVESDCEGESKRSNNDSPAKKASARFCFWFGRPFFRKRNCFSVVHVTQEGQKAKNNNEYANYAKTRDECIHDSSTKNGVTVFYQSLRFLFFTWMLLQDLNIDVSAIGVYNQFGAAAIDIT